MSEPNSTELIFEYRLSDDKAKLTIQLRDGLREYTAGEVTKLALFFANLRAEMCPPVPNESRDDLVPAVECDRYEVFQNPDDGESQIYMRTPGLFWSFIRLDKGAAQQVAEYLDPARVIRGDRDVH